MKGSIGCGAGGACGHRNGTGGKNCLPGEDGADTRFFGFAGAIVARRRRDGKPLPAVGAISGVGRYLQSGDALIDATHYR
ncbi:hypothetical protein EMIT0111MI5_100203 [Burkholderia sp. IT-111MI5]